VVTYTSPTPAVEIAKLPKVEPPVFPVASAMVNVRSDAPGGVAARTKFPLPSIVVTAEP